MHHIVKSLLRFAPRSKSASSRNINPRGFVGAFSSLQWPAGARANSSVAAEARLKTAESTASPVCSFNEWDPLEEVIVGRATGHRVPTLHAQLQATTRPESWKETEAVAGGPADPELVAKAELEAEELVKVLEMEGVRVQRPEEFRWDQLGTFRTPYFEEGGFKNTCPRDGILVVGTELIEAAMGWRSRLFEFHPYRKLLLDYFRRGADWTAAPRPTMHDDLYRKDYPLDDFDKQMELLEEGKFILTEAEVVFDAADAVRFGKDIFVTLTHTTNRSGVEWLKRHLAPRGYRVHSLLFKGTQNCHADATFLPLKPGLMIVSGERPCIRIDDKLVGWEFFEERGWDVVRVPLPKYVETMKDVSRWLHVNVLSLDNERVICQKDEPVMRDMLLKRGMKLIELDMRHCFYLGGAFHCWTVDIKRNGQLEDYGLTW